VRLSPLGPPKRVYLGLAALALLGAGVAQWFVERGRREALPPRPKKVHMVEIWPILLGGFRGPMIAGLAFYAQQKEIEADIYGTRSSIRTLIEMQPEFHHLWIYYSWVQVYNISAVLSSPHDKYPFFRDGIKFLEDGLGTIATLYEGRKKYVNDRCPIERQPIRPADVTEELLRPFQGQKVALLDDVAAARWDALTDTEKALKLEAVRGGSLQYKRMRATLLWTIGWNYYQKLSHGPDARQFYRPWYIRETNKDPFQVAHQYLRLASAVDVPPYQVSYEVLKTSAVLCLEDWARALAEDPRVSAKVVAEAFDRASKEWDETLPFVDERGKKRIAQSLQEIDLVSTAMRQMAFAEERAAVIDAAKARAALTDAKLHLDRLKAYQPLGSYQDVYRKRLDFTSQWVEERLKGEGL